MKEIIDDTEYDDQYEPVEISKSEGYYKNAPTTHYSITLEADFDEEYEEILEEFDLEVSGYTLETTILAYIEREQAELLDNIVSFDTESTTFVATRIQKKTSIKLRCSSKNCAPVKELLKR